MSQITCLSYSYCRIIYDINLYIIKTGNRRIQYMHIDNIKRANNSILTKINEIGSFFNSSDLCHTSSDGQKYNIDGCSLNANTSYKYHGRGQGVSSYIFLDNQFAHFYSTVISSSEREACYVPL